MIVILPCAGGSASNYKMYKSVLKKVYIHEYSGHWSRYEEELETSINQSVSSLKNEIEKKYSQEIIIFGHSMGGLIAWKLAHSLIEDGFLIKGLFIAACCPPEIRPDFIVNIHDDSDIKEVLKKIRQVPQKILNSAFFNEELLPVIRNDFLIVKNYIESSCLEYIDPLPVPITCLCGEDDPMIEKENMYKWKKYTNADYSCISFPGNHFFLFDKHNVEAISEIIKIKCLSKE